MKNRYKILLLLAMSNTLCSYIAQQNFDLKKVSQAVLRRMAPPMKFTAAYFCNGTGFCLALYSAIKGFEAIRDREIDDILDSLGEKLSVTGFNVTLVRNSMPDKFGAAMHCIVAGIAAAGLSYAGYQLSKQMILGDARLAEEKAKAQKA